MAIRLTTSNDLGVPRRVLEINGHMIQLRAIAAHPWASLKLIVGWLLHSRDEGGSV